MNRDANKHLYAFAGAAALVALSFLVYGYSIKGGFVYDDAMQVARNPWIRSYTFIDDIFTSHTYAFMMNQGYVPISYRPFFLFIYMIEYAIFGLEPWGWHAVNIILHSLNGVFIFFLIKRLLPADAKGFPAFAGPLLGAAFFVTLPVNSEAVSWVGCVPELVYTLFTLSAFYVYIVYRERGGAALLIVSAFLYFFAMLTKETAIVFPALIFIFEAASRGARNALSPGSLKKYAPYSAAALSFLAMRIYAIGSITPSEKISASLTGTQHLVNAFPLFFKYMRSLVLPINNHPLQLFEPFMSVSEPRVFLSILAAAVLAFVLFVFRKRIEPAHALSIALIILPLMPALYVPAVSRTPFADRYLYLPSAGLALGLALVFSKAGAKRLYVTLSAAFVLTIIADSVWAAKRSLVWKDERSLWTDVASGSSGNYLALHSLGLLDLKEGKTEESIEKLKAALKSNLESREPDLTSLVLTRRILGLAYHKKGLLDEAVKEYNEVLRIFPDDKAVYFNLGALYQTRGYYSDAVEYYNKALLFAGEPSLRKDILRSLGAAYLSLGLRKEAIASYEEALALVPGDPAVVSDMQKAREGL